MRVLYWNIRGIGNPQSRMELLNICRTHKLDYVCISEPMVNLTSILVTFWNSIGLQLISCNVRDGSSPNIWLFGSTSLPMPSVVHCSSQQITIMASHDNSNCYLSFVYASNSSAQRRILWQELVDVSNSIHDPFMVIGDFNAILGAHEKHGGRMPSRTSCTDFQNMVDTCNFMHLHYTGNLESLMVQGCKIVLKKG